MISQVSKLKEMFKKNDQIVCYVQYTKCQKSKKKCALCAIYQMSKKSNSSTMEEAHENSLT